ncbi:carotenoid 1,2-hydratase [Novosphingobium olei]|uniref:carotenoid 1,2-hydratase n=1 Tax=Novosphingobium olei TaxID=2728851 RepID=UPI0030881B2F|nr:carotenoid 1,2-hydratase [Novosphingobium olei]
MNKVRLRAAACTLAVSILSTGSFALPTAASAQAIGEFPPIETGITLPKDEAAHRQPAEWWYMTGFIDGTDPLGKKRSYAYQVVVFQIAPVAGLPPVYDAHFAISDLNRGTFSFEKRTLPGLFTSTKNRFDLDVLGFKMGGSMGGYYAKAARADLQYAIDLTSQATQGPTLNGANGVETYGTWKSPYYSYNVNRTTGTLWDHGVPIKVTGTTWYDHEWATGAPGQADSGWTWFGVSMDDNTQYNLSFFMKGNGTIDKVIGVKTANGTFTPIPENQLSLERMGSWKSPHTGYTYPASWKVNLPEGSINIVPMIQDAELYAPVTQKFYYEGPAKVTGTLGGRAVTGKAFAEMNPWGVDWGLRILP